MAWMIRNDGTVFEVPEIVALGEEQGEDMLSALAWLYDHTKCIATGYMILKMFAIWSRSKNRYLAPDRYLTFCTYKEKAGYLTADYISKIRDVLNEVDFRMRMNDSWFSESMVMQEAYLEHFSFLGRIAKIQLEQEFIYAFDDNDEMDESGYKNSLTFIDKSVKFDWTIIMRDFLNENRKFRERAAVLKHGRKIRLTDRISADLVMKEGAGSSMRDEIDRTLSKGRSVLSILGKAGYSWTSVLRYIERLRT